MSGAIPLLSTYAFMACTGTISARTVNAIQAECTDCVALCVHLFILIMETFSRLPLLSLQVQIFLSCNFIIFTILLLLSHYVTMEPYIFFISLFSTSIIFVFPLLR
jgi:hypothetical protein